MSNYKQFEDTAYSYNAMIGRAFYVKGKKVWIVNTTFYSNTTTKHQNRLKNELQQFIAIKSEIYCLNHFIGDESGLTALFETLQSERDINNVDALASIAQLLEITFDKDAYINACQEKIAENLIKHAITNPVPIPRWLKSFSPYYYEKLKMLNMQHKVQKGE